MILSCETARNVVFGYFPKVDGAGYKLDRFDFFTSNPNRDFAGIDSQRGKTAPSELKTWFRPSDVAVGPDGAIYVADWFDPRTGGHSALDNSFAGAIYRITPKGKKLTTPKLDVTTTAGQIAALKSPAVNVRALGFNALKAQGAAAVPAVAALLSDENPFVRARAIFLLAQLGAPGVAKVEGVLKSADAQERVAAFRALRRAGQPILARAKTLATDSAPTVRREVALALRDTPAAQAKDILLAVAKGYDGQDRAYLEAWGTGCTGKESEIYAALAATAPSANAATWSPAYANLVWRLTPRGAEGAFAARAAAEKLPEADRLAAVTALGFIPSREAVMALLDLAEKAKGAVKNHAFWWVINYKDIRWKEFGVDAALKQRGLYDPSAATIAEMLVPAAPETKLVVADIAKLTGNVANGEAAAARCLVCHRIGDQGVDYAPALTGFAKAQTTEVVINAIVNPSAEIAHGYEGTQVTLKDGSVVHGLMLSSGDPLVIQSMGGVTQLIPGSKVRNKSQLGRSLMLSADQLNLSAQEVADVVAYLKTK
jgi:putative heme-binding domain-containing protein